MYSILVRDLGAGHPEGRDDRAVREVSVRDNGGNLLFTQRFSANWEPHNFSVEQSSNGWILWYTCAGEQRSILKKKE